MTAAILNTHFRQRKLDSDHASGAVRTGLVLPGNQRTDAEEAEEEWKARHVERMVVVLVYVQN